MAATQSQHPVRAVVRTVFAFVAGLAFVIPFAFNAAGLDATSASWIAGVLAVSAAVTRVLAVPQVNDFLQKWVFTSWLAAEPSAPSNPSEPA